MFHAGRFSLRSTLVLLAGASFLLACVTQQAAGKKRKLDPVDPGDDFYDDDAEQPQPIEPAYVNDASGAFGAGSRPATGAKDASAKNDAGVIGNDAGPVTVKTYCTGPLAAGDLAIVEILITSRSGSGDTGEWVEIQNTHDTCWLKVQGVTIESPRGTSAPDVATVATALEVAPGGTFVVASSSDPTKNNGLTGDVIGWSATDVLKNDGDTVTVKSGTTVLDTITYPAFSNLEAGRSLAFPSDCAKNQRSDWARWSLTFTERVPGQKGTPNAPNDDVACF